MLSPPELPVISSPEASLDQGWRHVVARPSLPEIYRSLPIPQSAGFLRKLLAFAGPGYLVAVGYMDPATGLRTWPAARNTITRCFRSS